MVPVVYALPPSQNKPVGLLACIALNIGLYVFTLAAGARLGLGTDVLGGTLALISTSLAADAAIHDTLPSRTGQRSAALDKAEKMGFDALEVRPKYVLF